MTAAAIRRSVGAVLLALSLTACAATQLETAHARVAPDSFAPLVKQVLPSVVNIAVTEVVEGSDVLSELPPELKGTPFERQFRDRFRNRREQILGAGSGFIIDSSGLIVTNNHVVGHAAKIVVSLTDGTELPAKVIGSDDLTDVALIKVEATHPLPAVAWGDSRQVQVGDWIMAAGNPFGLGGSVIGVNTAIVSPTGGSVGIGFAIPSEIVSPIVAQLQNKGHIDRGWLGVSVSESASGTHGVAIAAVDKSGPAAKAGLRAGDVVTAINGERTDSARGLIRAVAATPPGNDVRLTVQRSGHETEISVTVGRRPASDNG